VSDQSASPGRPLLVALCPAAAGSAVPVQIPRTCGPAQSRRRCGGGVSPFTAQMRQGRAQSRCRRGPGATLLRARKPMCHSEPWRREARPGRPTCVGNLPSTEYLRPARLGSADTIVRRRIQRTLIGILHCGERPTCAPSTNEPASEDERTDGGPHRMRHITAALLHRSAGNRLCRLRCATEPTWCWGRRRSVG
jgi:hypothetical protein